MTAKKQLTLKALEQRLNAISDKATVASQRSQSALAQAGRAETGTNRLAQQQKQVTKAAEGVAAILDPLRSRVADLKWLAEVSVLKVTVMTEVSYLVSGAAPEGIAEMHARLMRALVQPDGWWIERQSQTLGDWIDALLELELEPSRKGRNFEEVLASLAGNARREFRAPAQGAGDGEG